MGFLMIPLLGGIRWWAVLRGLGDRLPVVPLMIVFSVATMVAQVLPSVAGDGLRVLMVTRKGVPLSRAIHSVFLERLLMLLALLLVGLATSPLLVNLTGSTGPIWLCLALLAAGAGGIGLLMTADLLAAGGTGWRFVAALSHVSADTRRLILSRWGGRLVAISVVSNLYFSLLAWLLARALALPVTASDLLAFMPFVTLATVLPISLGGWGVREGVLIFLLAHVGVAAPEALALSLLFGALSAVCGIPGLLAWSVGAAGGRKLAREGA